jgi:hypothetical protein
MKSSPALTAIAVAMTFSVSYLGAQDKEVVHSKQQGSVPIIYCTDLFHPHDDPDDHFDLATILSMSELDIKIIVLDQGEKQLLRPGKIPVSQMNRITGRKVPVAIGLGQKLKTPTDPGLDQKPEFQEGVAAILKALRSSATPVMVTTVGSVRDVVAAYNREPALFKAKVGRLLAFIGEASDSAFTEYNVELDPQAYIGLMRSGLPIYWVPCFDGGLWNNKGRASFWKARHEDLLKNTSPELIQFFIFALDKERTDPVSFLSSPVDEHRRARLFAQTRNLWCTAILGALSGRRIVFEGGRYRSVLPAKSRDGRDLAVNNDLFGFSEVDISITDKAVIQYGRSKDSKRIMRFEVREMTKYAEGMTNLTNDMLSRLGPAR